MTSPNLELILLEAAQSQKHVTVNEALMRLDASVQISVLDRDLSDPPSDPQDGDRYLVGGGASGTWLTQEGNLACWDDGAQGWIFLTPKEGWRVWVVDERLLLVRDGGTWIAVLGSILGINAVADAVNRLTVKSDAILFSHDDVTPGNGDMQVKINKATPGDTASFLFQTGYSGRAEFGLTGDDEFHLKVSPDGSTFHDAVAVGKDDGAVHVLSTLSVGDQTAAYPMKIVGTDSGRSAQFDTVVIEQVCTNAFAPFGTSDGFGTGIVWRGESYLNDTIRDLARISCHVLSSSGDTQGEAIVFETESTEGAGLSEKMRIAPGGNVGIGVKEPSATLDVDGAVKIGSFTVATVPNAGTAGAGSIIYVSDETGGGVPAFSDGSDWRRMTDRAVIS